VGIGINLKSIIIAITRRNKTNKTVRTKLFTVCRINLFSSGFYSQEKIFPSITNLWFKASFVFAKIPV
jgi:hypothetical protein